MQVNTTGVDETWVPLCEFPVYDISNLGNIRRDGRNITPQKNKRYPQVRLCIENKVYHRSLHRLVYESFKGPLVPGHHINHINGNKQDNRIGNLEQVSPQDNYAHAKRYVVKRGSAVSTAKLTDSDVINIIELRKTLSSRKIAEIYGMNKSSINRLLSGKNWSHIDRGPIDGINQ